MIAVNLHLSYIAGSPAPGPVTSREMPLKSSNSPYSRRTHSFHNKPLYLCVFPHIGQQRQNAVPQIREGGENSDKTSSLYNEQAGFDRDGRLENRGTGIKA